MKYFETSVTEIGAFAAEFEAEKMLILFGEGAPADLKDYCYNIQPKPLKKEIVAGHLIVFDDIAYPITAVGNKANDTFRELCHMTIKFDGKEVADLPGTMHVIDQEYPKLTVGTTISFLDS